MKTDRKAKPDPATGRLRAGPLGVHLDAFASFLAERSYSAYTIKRTVSLARHFGRWLQRRQRNLEDVAEPDALAYLRWRWKRRRRGSGDRSAMRLLLECLREQGLLGHPASVVLASEFDRLPYAYADYLRRERGLAEPTLSSYTWLVRRFLQSRFARRRGTLRALRPADVQAFLLHYVSTVGRGSAKLMVTALRSFFRFVRFCGETDVDLAASVLSVPSWRMTTLHRSVSAEEVRAILRACDRRTAKGRRDYAILLLLARLGLRSREIVGLTLDDLDWEQGEVVIRGKLGRVDRLPLSRDVGQALATYVRRDRPACSTRSAFIRIRAPRRGIGSAAVSTIVLRAAGRAGLHPPQRGAYLLRHSLATNMLRHGASLGEIGDLLRHRAPTTTQIYAKHDLEGLRMVVQPWPGGGG